MNKKPVFFLLFITLSVLFLTSCAIPGWNENFLEFIETGLSPVYLSSSSWRCAAAPFEADARSGEEVTVFVKLNNPKSFDLVYTLSVDSRLVDGTPVAPTGTTGADNNITTVSFAFTPAETAEHGDIVFSLGVTCPAINRTFNPVPVTVRCDSPPGPVGDLTAGLDRNGMACIGFTLPVDYINADVAAVRITYTDNASTTKPVGMDVSRTGDGLKTVPMPALLNSSTVKHVRYFCPLDVVPYTGNDFTVTTIDQSGKESSSVPVSVASNVKYLAYDANGGTGTVAAQYGIVDTPVDISDGSHLIRSGYILTGWKDQGGMPFSLGQKDFKIKEENTILYAQWEGAGVVHVQDKDTLSKALETLDAYIVMDNDIDLGPTWTPIGSSDEPFTGTFDGGGKSIIGLTVANQDNAGMFGYVGKEGTVKNLHLENVSMPGSASDKGAIAASNMGTIYRCSSSGTLSGGQRIGGLVGQNFGVIQECWSNASVTAVYYSGGLVGANGNDHDGNGRPLSSGHILDCYSRGAVNVMDGGGLLGVNTKEGTVTNSYAAGSIIQVGSDSDAGIQVLIGRRHPNATSKIINCYFDESKIDKPMAKNALIALSDCFGTRKTTEAMKDATLLGGPGIWTIEPGKNGGYPYLTHVTPSIDKEISGSMTASAFKAFFTDLNGDYKLTGTVTLTLTIETAWTALGSAAEPFTGTFDGGGKTITSLKLAPNTENSGMFHTIGVGGVVKNLHLEAVSITGTERGFKGALAVTNNGTIFRCSTSGLVTGGNNIGGLVYSNTGTISECWSNATVTGDTWVGGLVGANSGTIENCYARGAVTAESGGGLVGQNYTSGTIVNSYAAGFVTVNPTGAFLQPLVGLNENSTGITNCYFDESKIVASYAMNQIITTDFNGTPKTTEAMKTATLFGGSGIWTIAEGTNGGYPFLTHIAATIDKMFGVENQTTSYTADDFRLLFTDLSADYKLSGKITLTTDDPLSPWIPLGSEETPFTGNFDGNGNIITGVRIANKENGGFFACVGLGGTVKNLHLEGVYFVSDDQSTRGGVAAINKGTLYRCSVAGHVRGVRDVGGLVGRNEGTIEECYSIAAVDGKENVGGLIGSHTSGTVINSYARGMVCPNNADSHNLGGFVGATTGGVISTSYSTGKIFLGQYPVADSSTGGFIGKRTSFIIENCFYDKDKSGQSDNIAKGAPLSTADMHNNTKFTSWNIYSTVNSSYVWGIEYNIGYPYLQWAGVASQR